MEFHVIASTGRTATTFLARALDNLERVAACHEGYRAADKSSEPLLPLINLENRRAFNSAGAAREIVAAKRGPDVLEPLARDLDCEVLIDAAYYNSTIAGALLEAHPDTRMIAIIRDLESFVRSATATHGEDPLPVGWADPQKPLTPREKFIELGRIRPAGQSPDGEAWHEWSAIMRNIWLWRETNALLIGARERFPERVLLLRFVELGENAETFLGRIVEHFAIPGTDIPAALAAAQRHRNRKPSGYQIGPMAEWSNVERRFANTAREMIGDMQWAY